MENVNYPSEIKDTTDFERAGSNLNLYFKYDNDESLHLNL